MSHSVFILCQVYSSCSECKRFKLKSTIFGTKFMLTNTLSNSITRNRKILRSKKLNTRG